MGIVLYQDKKVYMIVMVNDHSPISSKKGHVCQNKYAQSCQA